MPLPAPSTKRTVRRTYKYRIYPTATQVAALEDQLRFCCDLYNAALEQRRDAWRQNRYRVSYYDQQGDLTEISQSGGLGGMAVWAARDPLLRLDRAFRAFFRRVKSGDVPGYPRFRSYARYDSLTWPIGNGAAVCESRLRLKGIGAVRVRWHRGVPEEAEIKTITVKRSAGCRWYVSLSLRVPLPDPQPYCAEVVGVDLGIQTFAALSTGERIKGPYAYRHAERDLRVAQRRVSRRRKGSNRRRKAALILARKHERVRNLRRDHAHKTAHGLVVRFDLIAVEDLNVKGLARSALAKDVSDQGWGQFLSLLRDKAEWAGREVIAVDPRGTSQECSECGVVVSKGLKVRTHICACGYVSDRDVNAARNILHRAVGTRPSGANGREKKPVPLPEKFLLKGV